MYSKLVCDVIRIWYTYDVLMYISLCTYVILYKCIHLQKRMENSTETLKNLISSLEEEADPITALALFPLKSTDKKIAFVLGLVCTCRIYRSMRCYVNKFFMSYTLCRRWCSRFHSTRSKWPSTRSTPRTGSVYWYKLLYV